MSNNQPIIQGSKNEALINIIMLTITTGGMILFSVIGGVLRANKEKSKKVNIDTFDKYDIEAFLKEA